MNTPVITITRENPALTVNPCSAAWLARRMSPAPTALEIMARMAVSRPMRPVITSCL